MKFNSLQHTGVRTFSVKDFSGGVNLYDLPSNIADNQLSDCHNVWHEGATLCSRPGLSSATDNILHTKASESEENSYYISDTCISLNGDKKQIAVANVCSDDSIFFSYIYFVGEDNIPTAAGEMIFYRTTDEIFYQPANILFYVGTAVNGGGIFAFVTSVNKYNSSDKCYYIYEISSDFSSWNRVNDYYVPTVYINGRGTRYEESKASNQAYTGEPTSLESPNMLNGRFHAYFSSDGYSSCFRLPFSNLSGQNVVCRIYHTLTGYVEWNILSGETSCVRTFFNASVTLSVDRVKGIIYFTDSGGNYPIPMMSLYHENNIKITAYKTILNGFEDIVSSRCYTIVDSKIILAGGNNKNSVYAATLSNPLYFPENSSVKIGGHDQCVTGLTVQGNYILAFKTNELYALKFRKGTAVNTTSLLADNDKIFYKSDTFSCEILSGELGCINKKTIKSCGNQTVWQANDGVIYTLKSINGREIYDISKPIKKQMLKFQSQELLEAFAVCKNGYYMLMISKKAFIMEYTLNELKCPKANCNSSTNENIKWYIWDFPETLSFCGGFAHDGMIKLLCLGSDNSVCYIASLDGNKDIDIYLDDGLPSTNEMNIFSSFSTRQFNLGSLSRIKDIKNIFLSVSCNGDFIIKLNGKYFDTVNMKCFNDNGYQALNSVRLIPALANIDSVYITIESVEELSFGEFIIYYVNIDN